SGFISQNEDIKTRTSASFRSTNSLSQIENSNLDSSTKEPSLSSSSSSTNKFPSQSFSRRSSRSFSPIPLDKSDHHPLQRTNNATSDNEDTDSFSDLPPLGRVPTRSERSYRSDLSSSSEADVDSDDSMSLSSETQSRPQSIYSSSPVSPTLFGDNENLQKIVRRTVSLNGMNFTPSATLGAIPIPRRDRSASQSKLGSGSEDSERLYEAYSSEKRRSRPSSIYRGSGELGKGESTSDVEVAALLSMENSESLSLANGKRNAEFHDLFPKILKDELLVEGKNKLNR
ncbi:hypothetical protein HK096_010362, partial [Nowakowskiella sp. JEL0078]